jgi:hypothetical protein
MELAGNMTKEETPERKTSFVKNSQSIKDYGFFDLVKLAGKLVALFLLFVVILWFVVLFILSLLTGSLRIGKNNDIDVQSAVEKYVNNTKTENTAKNTGIKETETKSSTIYTYFIKASDINFTDGLKKEIYSWNDEQTLTFVLEKYSNGDIWLREGDPYANLFFIPIEYVTLNNEKYQYLTFVNNVEAATDFLPNSSGYAKIINPATDENYQSLKNAARDILTKKALVGDNLEGIIILECDKSHLTMQNFTFHYQFEEYKAIQTSNGIVYELADGKRVSRFLEISHSLVIDQESSKVTTMYSELQLNN